MLCLFELCVDLNFVHCVCACVLVLYCTVCVLCLLNVLPVIYVTVCVRFLCVGTLYVLFVCVLSSLLQDAFIVPIKSKPHPVLCVVWVCAVFTVCIFNGHFLLSEVFFHF